MDFTGVPIAAGFVGELSWDHAGRSDPTQIKTNKVMENAAILLFIYQSPYRH